MLYSRSAKKDDANPVQSNAGFTLIEMMIVLAIIAMIMGFVGSKVIRRFDESKVSATTIQIKQLQVILDDFRRVCGFYPTTEQGLDALVKAPVGRICKNYDPEGFIKKIPQDAWNHDFVYTSDGNKIKIVSLGADNKEGGEGFDKDLSSDDLN
jgi:general secretion pathway protein G